MDGTFAASSVAASLPAQQQQHQQASFSSSSDSAELQSLFNSLHPHVESTDLQLPHLLGSDWSGLSTSQLSVLDEIYTSLSRQIRDAQFHLFHQQQQDVMSELVRTRSEMHAMRKEIAAMRNSKEGQSGNGNDEAD